jgi:hypothetical protein
MLTYSTETSRITNKIQAMDMKFLRNPETKTRHRIANDILIQWFPTCSTCNGGKHTHKKKGVTIKHENKVIKFWFTKRDLC